MVREDEGGKGGNLPCSKDDIRCARGPRECGVHGARRDLERRAAKRLWDIRVCQYGGCREDPLGIHHVLGVFEGVQDRRGPDVRLSYRVQCVSASGAYKKFQDESSPSVCTSCASASVVERPDTS